MVDPELPLIFTFVVGLALIVFTFAGFTHRRVIRHEERKLELKAQIAQAKSATGGSSDGDYARLEERVRVLERIATDSDQTLARQIEALRDVQELDQLSDKRETAQ